LIPFGFPEHSDRPTRLLCLGAHSDDLEIGCAGTVMALVDHGAHLEVTWIVLSAQGDRRHEAEASAAALLGSIESRAIRAEAFPDGFFPSVQGELKEYFETLPAGVQPDVILTHHRHDRHQDHRIVSELTWNTFRHHFVLEYEVPKYEGDLGHPNVFVPLPVALVEQKIHAITRGFPSQRHHAWFRPELFRSLMCIRGLESASPSGYAEAFHCPKLLLQP
jgi:LmbE family N-acetylglucosaminyl deacetylase